MTSATPNASGASVPLRPLTAWALLLFAALSVFFGFLAWIFPPSRTDFFGRFDTESFTGLAVLVAPLLAVLLVTKVGPVLSQAKLVSLAALGIYGAAAIFGALAFLITFASRFDGLEGGIYAFGGVIAQFGDILLTLLRLALLVLAMLWTYQIFNGLGGRLPHLNVDAD
ncbi:hypothetical protein JQS43_05865 [Natronosporangium hydrolyticum]|uniref:Uncharacterized protein n=1 Tax=Natronosporangium hydrolyticum TaxID=2811111 RepID=A0A895YDK0_9ACTN|nr:hypothetical protein [Natronosporangium hydrolyticum]QSB15857.1 hypothetical protein JQS43_05865 [Natronosporangium hydrolyticum]